jgi:hypothetical protein
MTSIKKTISVLIISTLTINCSFAQWSEDANNIHSTNSDKKVGIGITTPEYKLHIVDGSQSIKFLTGTASSGYDLSIGINDNGVNFTNNSFIRGYNFNNASGNLLNVASNGDVGIGITNPTEKLSVNGAIRIVGGQPIYFLADHNDPNYLIQSGAWNDGMKYKHWTSHQFFTDGKERFRISWNGNIGIGVVNPTAKLEVNGTIKAKQVTVTQTGWADYVFDKNYTLMPVDSLSTYIKTHKHLPEIPTTKDVQDNGVDVGNNQALLLKKIEELTLYIIEQHKEIEALKKKIK